MQTLIVLQVEATSIVIKLSAVGPLFDQGHCVLFRTNDSDIAPATLNH